MVKIIIILSPTKTLNMEKIDINMEISTPVFLDKSKVIIETLKKKNIDDLKKLMKINGSLTELTFNRIKQWNKYNGKDEKPCIFSYMGEAYKELSAVTFSKSQLEFCNNHFRILSGLYGVLKPLDGIKPYRLEMATKLSIDNKKNLYEFWKIDINNFIEHEISLNKEKLLINLASEEYFKVISIKSDARIITPVFKERKGLDYKVISIYAKKARGKFANYIIKNKIENVEQLKEFKELGYRYVEDMSEANIWVYIRD